MRKDFKLWFSIKKKVDELIQVPQANVREIWWSAIGTNVGVETDGKNELFERPVLIFRKFNSEMFWGLPLTSHERPEKLYYFQFSLHGEVNTALLSQIRVFSSKRLLRRLGRMSAGQFRKLNYAFNLLLNETDPLRGPQVPHGNNI